MHDYTTSSLDKFRRKFGQSISAAYIVHPGDIRQKYGILYMPIYMNSLAYWCEPCIAGGYSVSNERGARKRFVSVNGSFDLLCGCTEVQNRSGITYLYMLGKLMAISGSD